MPEHMSGAEMAAHRTLIGLSMQELADLRGISDTRNMRAQEAGKAPVSPATAAELRRLKETQEATINRLAEGVEEGMIISIPRGATDEYPKGFWRGVAARLIDRHPEAMLDWDEDGRE